MPTINHRCFRVLLGLGLTVVIAGCSQTDPAPGSAGEGGSTGSEAVESVLDFVPLAVEPMPCGEGAFAEGAACLVPAGEKLGDDIVESAAIAPPQNTGWTVSLVMTVDGNARFNEVASSCFNKDENCPSGRVGIVSDGELVSAPLIQAAAFEPDQILISGNFTHEEALAIVEALNS